MMLAISCSALLGLLLFGLGAAVTSERRRSQTYYGHNEDPSNKLYKLIRAHGNTSEYAAMLCVLMLLAAHNSTALWTQIIIVTITASRYLQVAGMLAKPTMKAPPNAFAIAGTLGTYVGGIALCIVILMSL